MVPIFSYSRGNSDFSNPNINNKLKDELFEDNDEKE